MEQHLSVAAIPVIMDDNVTNAGSHVTVKEEPLPSNDIQEEGTTEPDKLMKVEDCTKSQLTLSDDNSDQRYNVENSYFTIKKEPLSIIIDIKEEVTTEADKLVMVEDCTKSQLTLSDDNSDQRYNVENSYFTIKKEPLSIIIDIKEEVTTEADKLVMVEDCTKSQLTLSDDNSDQRYKVENSYFTIKKEPLSIIIDIKEEVTTEADIVVKVEDCTKSQLTLSDDNSDRRYKVENSYFTIKNEPVPSIDIKEEVTTEADIVVKAEDCTKSQLILVEDNSDQGKNVEKLLCNDVHDEKIKTYDSKIQLENNCNKNLNLNSNLTSHNINTHFQRTEKQVSPTMKDTKSTSLIEDKPIQNLDKKWWACKICDKKFDSNSSLSCHLKSHSEEQPFACTICDKKFDCTGNLGRHVRSHLEEKSFACNVCDQQYNRKDRLDKHMRIHTGLKSDNRFTCNVCDKLFISKFNLDRHMKIHTRKKL